MDAITGPAIRRRAWRSDRARISWAMSALGAVALGAVLTRATIAEVRTLGRPLPPQPPEVARDIVVSDSDKEGRSATFRILLFTDEFRWRMSSHDQLEQKDAQPHFSDEMRAVLNDAREIICVGASSEELAPGLARSKGRAIEERRAARRAEKIAVWVRSAISTPVPIRKLNVGHHAPTGHYGDTSDQRRVVIILVLERDQKTNLDQALRAAMSHESVRAPIFDTLLTRYSLSAGDTFSWVE